MLSLNCLDTYSSASPPMASEPFDLSDLLAILPIPSELSLFFNLNPDFPLEAVAGRSPVASAPFMCETSDDSDLACDGALTAELELPMDEPPSDCADGSDAEPFVLGPLEIEDLGKPRLMRESGRRRPSGSVGEPGVSPFVSVSAGVLGEDTPAKERVVGETRTSGVSGAGAGAKTANSGANAAFSPSIRGARLST